VEKVIVIDEHSRERLAMAPLRRFRSNDVIDVLADLFIEHGPPEHIRSNNGPEFVAHARVQDAHAHSPPIAESFCYWL
jgi:hypothetical protein